MNNKLQTATFGNGCFWCTEAIFKRLKGVLSVTPGYSGGKVDNPTYEQVSSGTTGHAEATQIEFDPSIISYVKLLDIFWYTHNPTTLNRQGNDIGTQYRSVIFYNDENQKLSALKSKDKISKSNIYKDPIITEITPLTKFYPAEDYHKDYYAKNQTAPYCNLIISPKIHKLLEEYKTDVKEEYS